MDDILEKKVNPKAIFLDVMMPIINGYEILDKFKEKNILVNTPIIVCTAMDVPETIENKYKDMNIKFLSKPISTTTVLQSYKSLVH